LGLVCEKGYDCLKILEFGLNWSGQDFRINYYNSLILNNKWHTQSFIIKNSILKIYVLLELYLIYILIIKFTKINIKNYYCYN